MSKTEDGLHEPGDHNDHNGGDDDGVVHQQCQSQRQRPRQSSSPRERHRQPSSSSSSSLLPNGENDDSGQYSSLSSIRSSPSSSLSKNNIDEQQQQEEQDHHHNLYHEEDGAGRWYFCVGPLVHPAVRQRRGLDSTAQYQAAVLLDYKLVFTHAGVDCRPKIGYNVQGVVMRVPSDDDWNNIVEADSAAYRRVLVDVFPYGSDKNNSTSRHRKPVAPGADEDYDLGDNNDESSTEIADSSSSLVQREPDDDDYHDDDNDEMVDILVTACKNRPIRAYVSIMNEYDESIHEVPLENKPQERYLRLVAEGMRHHGVNETYIADEIMSCSYIPKRSQGDWYEFPKSIIAATTTRRHNTNSSTKNKVLQQQELPVLTMKKYERLCRKNNKPDSDIYFILHNYVLKMSVYEPQNPMVIWMRGQGHGKPDLSYVLHQIVVDPDIPWARTRDDMTLLHYGWAEDHVVEAFKLSGVTATKVYQLQDENETTTSTFMSSSFSSVTGGTTGVSPITTEAKQIGFAAVGGVLGRIRKSLTYKRK